MPESLFKINVREYVLPGNRSCQGCALSLAYRMALKALREKTMMVIGPSCLCVLHGLYPNTPSSSLYQYDLCQRWRCFFRARRRLTCLRSG